ncbi:glycosyltransferase family 25 protein [Microbacterium sp. NPDC056052]|uniref:glycosyltransferase family 25 protein n=1 Tax=Microbacterium sp. NPDC056052 TaxID=3345695 RepID=UPI0035E2F222
MPVLTMIIGLERNFRGAPLEGQLKEIGVAAERVAGVEVEFNGLPVTRYADSAAVSVLYGRPLREAEIGCALAHRVCYQRLIDSPEEWALVFEDDARIARPAAVSDIVNRLGALAPFNTPAVLMLYGRQMVGDPRYHSQIGVADIHELMRTPMTATSYFINRAAARHFLSTGLPLRNPADWPVSAEREVRFAAAYPWPVIPDEVDAPSSIGSRGGGRNALARVGNRVESTLYVKWLRRRHHYRSLTEYHDWEIRRRIVHLALGSAHPYRVPVDAVSLPVASRKALTVDRLLGGRRDAEFVEYLGMRASASSDRLDTSPVDHVEGPLAS